jgi:hypothetical protein
MFSGTQKKKVGVSQKTIDNKIGELVNMDKCPKVLKVSALYQDADWQPPTMNVWHLYPHSLLALYDQSNSIPIGRLLTV